MPYFGFKAEVLTRLDRIIALQEAIGKIEESQMATIDDIVGKVTEEKTMIGSLKVFVQGLQDQVKAVPGVTPDMQTKIDGVFANVSANSQSISDAMVANTPKA